MLRKTTHYEILKPDYNEIADIEVLNSNMDIIDVALHELKEDLDVLSKELGILPINALNGYVTDNYMYNPSTGEWAINNKVVTTDKFEFYSNEIKTSIDTGFVVLFDAEENFIRADATTSSPRKYTIEDDNVKYIAIMYLKTGLTFDEIESSNISGVYKRNLIPYSEVVKNIINKEVIEVGNEKEFTSVYDALTYASNIINKKVVINIFDGIYDIFTEMGGETFISNIPDGAIWRDILPILKGNVEINGIGNVELKMIIPDDIYNSNKAKCQILSIINNIGSIAIKNITFKTANNRYAIHDECDSIIGYDNTVHIFENCRFYANNSVALIGVGTSSSRYIIKNCYMNNTWNGFYLHGWSNLHGAEVIIENSIINANNHSILLGVNSLNKSNVKLSNCYINKDIYIDSENDSVYTNDIYNIIGSNVNLETVTLSDVITSSTTVHLIYKW